MNWSYNHSLTQLPGRASGGTLPLVSTVTPLQDFHLSLHGSSWVFLHTSFMGLLIQNLAFGNSWFQLKSASYFIERIELCEQDPLPHLSCPSPLWINISTFLSSIQTRLSMEWPVNNFRPRHVFVWPTSFQWFLHFKIIGGGAENELYFRHMKVEHAQSCPTLPPIDCTPAGSSVHGIPQARTLGWVALIYMGWNYVS